MLERRRYVRIAGKKSNTTERRKFVRIPENSQISYRVLTNMKNKGSLTKDISQGGIRFLVHEFIPVNSILEISITLKNISFYFQTVVKSRWITEELPNERYEIGVEFINIPKKSTEHLIDYIKSILECL